MKSYKKLSAVSLIGILFVSSIATAMPENAGQVLKRVVKKDVQVVEVLPMTYAQVGTDAEGLDCLRFATPVDLSVAKNLTYTRTMAGREANVAEVKTAYKGIVANGGVYYYDGNEVTDVPNDNDYYWANYMVKFSPESTNKGAMLTVELDVDGTKAPFLTTSYNAVAQEGPVATFKDSSGALVGRSIVESGNTPVYAGEALQEGQCWTDGVEYYDELPTIVEDTIFEITENPYNEENVNKTSLTNIGDYVLETFGDRENPVLIVDNYESPETRVTTDGIESCSLSYVSNGNFSGPYLKFQPGLLEVGSTYKLSFDYKLTALVNTIYFQYYNNNVVTDFKQFGVASDIGQVKHFEYYVNVTHENFVIKVFPGNGNEVTSFLMDNFKVEKVEQNVYKANLTNVGDYVLETFGDKAKPILTIDNYQTPSTAVVEDGIEGSSLSFVSSGNFACAYLKPYAGLFTAGHSYKISFDYKLTAFADTIYFQYWNGGTSSFTQFGNVNQIGQLQHFEYTLEVTDANFMFQIFPGASTNPTSFLMDNFRIELV